MYKTPTLTQQLQMFEDEKHVRRCMNRYMSLCDELNAGFDLERLMALFSENAVWQGAGKRYAKTFGRYESKDQIKKMFAKYVRSPAHFSLNAHFLCNELIEVDGAQATGHWMLIQPSTFSTGKSQLSCARITVRFIKKEGVWLISWFNTENIFSRPMQEPWDSPEPLAVPD